MWEIWTFCLVETCSMFYNSNVLLYGRLWRCEGFLAMEIIVSGFDINDSHSLCACVFILQFVVFHLTVPYFRKSCHKMRRWHDTSVWENTFRALQNHQLKYMSIINFSSFCLCGPVSRCTWRPPWSWMGCVWSGEAGLTCSVWMGWAVWNMMMKEHRYNQRKLSVVIREYFSDNDAETLKAKMNIGWYFYLHFQMSSFSVEELHLRWATKSRLRLSKNK